MLIDIDSKPNNQNKYNDENANLNEKDNNSNINSNIQINNTFDDVDNTKQK